MDESVNVEVQLGLGSLRLEFQQELVTEVNVPKQNHHEDHDMDLDTHQDGIRVDDDHCSLNLQHRAVRDSNHPFLDFRTGLHHQGAADGDGQGAADGDGQGPGGLLLPVCESEKEKDQQQQSQNCGHDSVFQLGAALHDLDNQVLSHGHSALFYQGPDHSGDKLAALHQGLKNEDETIKIIPSSAGGEVNLLSSSRIL